MKLDQFIEMENLYVEQFSIKKETHEVIEFVDHNLPNMYTHNFLYIKQNKHILSKIEQALEKRKSEKKDFLRIETYFKINDDILNQLSIKPEETIYDFMYIQSKRYQALNGNIHSEIIEAKTNEVLQAGLEVDVLCNIDGMGDFAKIRIKRKKDIYQEKDSKIKFYVCFYQGKAIGKCEMMIDEKLKIAKIEDFDIYQPYQRKGFGTAVLRNLLERAYLSHINDVYLITHHHETAKEMYQKCGFQTTIQKFEYFFSLT